MPSYVIVMSDGRHYVYGQKAGEDINYQSMDLFLQSLNPCADDLYQLCFFAINLCICLHYFFWVNCSAINRFLHVTIKLFQYNLLFKIIWWIMNTLNQYTSFIDYMNSHISIYGFNIFESAVKSDIASLIRYDILNYYNTPFLLIAFL